MLEEAGRVYVGVLRINMGAIKLSVLIPTYNREKYVSMAIDSVLNQEFQNFEIICSDNASTDETYNILLEYASKDDRIKVFRNKENLGPVINWKNCLDNASGEFIHWLWSDDWIESNFYKDSFELMTEEDTKIVSTWNYRSDNPADISDKYVSWQFSLPSVPGKIASKKLLLSRSELPASPAAYILPIDLVRQNFYQDIPKMDDKLDPVAKGVGVDSLMVIGCCQSVDKISILQKPSVVFRKHDNISTQLGKDGSLGRMYAISHIWYMSNVAVKLSVIEMLKLVLRTCMSFKSKTFNPILIKCLAGTIMKSIFVAYPIESDRNYISNKAVFK